MLMNSRRQDVGASYLAKGRDSQINIDVAKGENALFSNPDTSINCCKTRSGGIPIVSNVDSGILSNKILVLPFLVLALLHRQKL